MEDTSKQGISDENLKREIAAQLSSDARISLADLRVDVRNQIATLSGIVPNHLARRAALDDAWTVPGVLDVRDHIKIRYPEFISLPSDQELKSRVEAVLSWNPATYPLPLQVRVEDGLVILSGSVDAHWKKLHAEQVASDVRGVHHITNKISIVPTEDFLDRNIAETIVETLERHPLANLNSIDIQVENGKVTLSGQVPGHSIRKTVHDIVSRTAGVREVTDLLTINSNLF